MSAFKKPVYFVLLAILLLSACKTTQSVGLQDYSNGIHIAVTASATNPAYTITETAGAAGSGYAYLLERTNRRWRVMYDSFDAKVFAKAVGSIREVPADSEVLWTDGTNVVVYFGTEPLLFSRKDGSFACPKNKETPGHRACRSALSKAESLFGGLGAENTHRLFVLDFGEIRQAVEDTGIVAIAKRRLAAEK
ncbi:MAG: hypothetical protein L3J84_07815 [Gammaproteobacteria bacterium]|nr:hypothetical protein [Gammaproteobacteria bacterium]